MLQELRIENLALIRRLELEFRPGLNVLTGETGAGKSIILGAIGLLIGERSAPEMVRSGAESARVEAALSLELPVQGLLAEAGIEHQPGEPLILARQVYAGGRSRAYVNGRLATNAMLKALGELWIDIHGQHAHQSLFRVPSHRELLDAFGGLSGEVAAMRAAYHRVQELRRRFRELQDELRTVLRERELLEYELKELEEAQLQPDEEELLDAERKRLVGQQRLAQALELALSRLALGEEGTALEGLQAAVQALQAVHEASPELAPTTERLEALSYELEELVQGLRERRGRLEYRPERLQAIDERLQVLWRLKQKYRAELPELLRRQEEVRRRLEFLRSGTVKLESLREELRRGLREAGRLAFRLSELRAEAAERFARRVREELEALGMERTGFQVEVVPSLDESGLIRRAGRGYNLQEYGVDRVEFLFAPNLGEEPRPLHRIASGGEISRVMLAIKAALIEVDPVPVLVFDEVDAGVGGETAHRIGAKLAALARRHQVLCVTHLPQIAALADHHLRVEKRVQGSRTETTAVPLAPQERVRELARMLGGDSETARALAQQFLERRTVPASALDDQPSS